MAKTKRNVKKKLNKTKKCPIGLKPIMSKYIDGTNNQLRKYSQKEFVNKFLKELLSKFAPHSIKPENNFYDYINYQ